MSNIDVDKIRNIAVIAHGGAGKTSLVEAMLYNSGSIDRLGNIEDGTTTTDYEPEEIERKMTVTSSVAFCSWNGYKINLIDTPGFINFVEDSRGCLKAVDGAIIIVSAISGVKAETEKMWRYASEFEIPGIVFINKMDKDNANFYRAIGELEKVFNIEALPLQVPVGVGNSFIGIVDLIKMKSFKFNNGKAEEIDIPSDVRSQVEEYRKKLVEKIAEADDSLLEKYLEEGGLSDEEVIKGVREGSLTKRFMPVTCGSANSNIGIPQLLDIAALCLPSPVEMAHISPVRGKNPKDGKEVERKPLQKEPFSAYVFKTIADPFAGRLSIFRVYSGTLKADSNVLNASKGTKERVGQVFYLMGKKQIPVQTVGPGEIGVVAKLKETFTGDTLSDESNQIVFEKVKFADPLISYAIEPKSKGDEEKVGVSLSRILEEDPTLRFQRDEETKEMLLSGMGQVHLEVTLERLKRKFGVEVIMKTPKVPYRETIKVSAKAQGKYKKQSGGRGQYGDCHIQLDPLPRGGGYEFVDKVVGGAIPRQYIPAVEKGIVETMQEGVIAGYPIVDFKVTLFDGTYHTVDSSEMAFKIAGSMALKKAIQDAKPVLLEPIMKAEVITPDDALGAIIGDLNSKRGRVQGVEPQAGGNQKITCLVPMSEMLTYANQLHSLTSGRGLYSMEFSHYEEMPAHLTQKIVAERQAKKEKENQK
ncbi:MAG: translation elongation factor G [Nitrospirae bacterium RBG_13_39_12]|nr:MAG: translation elongation factor G [Nitrospirae bacterium RBG_13_39_12]